MSTMHRAWARLPPQAREALLTGLSPSELRTVLLEVSQVRAATVTPAEVLRRWESDPLITPAISDPRRVSQVEAALWRLLPDDVVGIDLSPVAPLGTCSSVAPGSQNRIVTTTRGPEVVSDNTNALAVEAARRRRDQPPDGTVHLAACSTVLRAQPFGGAPQHFRLFALVSSARDTGSRQTESELLRRHVQFWQRALRELATTLRPQVEVSVFDDPALDQHLPERLSDASADQHVPLVFIPERERGRGYYTSVGLRLALHGGEFEIGDGGLISWTATLTGTAKERCMASVLATQRLATTSSES